MHDDRARRNRVIWLWVGGSAAVLTLLVVGWFAWLLYTVTQLNENLP